MVAYALLLDDAQPFAILLQCRHALDNKVNTAVREVA